MFADKYNTHKYKNEIIERFEFDVPIKDIQAWLASLEGDHKLSGDTLRRHKRRHTENRKVNAEVDKVKEEYGECSDIEGYLLETIAQCRLRKKGGSITGKDYQYYDQQMQNAIQLLQKIRGDVTSGVDLSEVFSKLTKDIINDEKTAGEGADNKVS